MIESLGRTALRLIVIRALRFFSIWSAIGMAAPRTMMRLASVGSHPQHSAGILWSDQLPP